MFTERFQAALHCQIQVQTLLADRDNPLQPFGILGGMGPASTVRFLDLLIARYRTGMGALLNSDFPQITLHTIPDAEHLSSIPDRQILTSLEKAFKVFETAGACFAVAPCNTVHQFLPLQHMQSNVQVLSIVIAALKSLPEPLQGKRVLFLSTRQTQITKLYDLFFLESHSEPVFLTPSDQEAIDDIIINANAGGTLGDLTIRLSNMILRYNVDMVLLACTELSLLVPLIGTLPVLDTLETLVEATYLVSSGQRDIAFYTSIYTDA